MLGSIAAVVAGIDVYRGIAGKKTRTWREPVRVVVEPDLQIRFDIHQKRQQY